MEDHSELIDSNSQDISPAHSPPSSPPPTYRPPLPPRETSYLSPNFVPEQGIYHSQPTNLSWSAQDPRNASTESIVPVGKPSGKRVLLLIYIHGFMGDETSFQSFPAHVHNVVTPLVQETHVVHTKIYPKYRSRKHIQFARDNFSLWVIPHEGKDVDVILFGHSMGGLLSAEVVLLPPASAQDPEPFKHRILGTINLDVPFLGLHPGVVLSGISSLFRPAPKSPPVQPVDQPLLSPDSAGAESQSQLAGAASVSTLSLSQPSPDDPTYNPAFVNDVHLPVRKGWESTLHFIQKHSDGLTRATKSYVKSHLEFGGAVTDPLALRARYRAIRALEDVEWQNEESGFRSPRRVRFVNYYTASTGIRKKSPVRTAEANKRPSPSPSPSRSPLKGSALGTSDSPMNSPRISIEEPEEVPDTQLPANSPTRPKSKDDAAARTPSTAGSFVSFESAPEELKSQSETSKAVFDQGYVFKASRSSSQVDLRSGSSPYVPYPPGPSTVNKGQASPLSTSVSALTGASAMDSAMTTLEPKPEAIPTPSPAADAGVEFPGLPPLPDTPTTPPPFDATPYTNKDSRKLAEREHERRVKAHSRALKEREQAIKARKKLLEKREKELRKQRQKEEEGVAKNEKEEAKRLKKEEEAAYKQWRHELKELEKKRKAKDRQAAEEAKLMQPAAEAEMRSAEAATGNVPTEANSSHAPGEEQERKQRPPPLSLQESESGKKQRDRKFCILPSRDSKGQRDSAWVRVFMRDVDEVIAHCGVFDAWREHYEGLVVDVGNLIKEWVDEDARAREQGDSRRMEEGTTWSRRDDDGTERGVVEG